MDSKKTNDWVHNKAVVAATVRHRQSKEASTLWSRHEETREKEIMQGTMPGARGRGRPRTAWVDNIKTWTGLPVVIMTEDRTEIGESSLRPWRGQPSDRGRLKNRTEQNSASVGRLCKRLFDVCPSECVANAVIEWFIFLLCTCLLFFCGCPRGAQSCIAYKLIA